MNVSLYDLLDVEESATAAEIRSAWKSAIADLDPTDRRFRAYNDAAGVLLDPEKRAAYDAELAAARAGDEADVDPTDEPPAAAPAVPIEDAAATPTATTVPEREPEDEPEPRDEAEHAEKEPRPDDEDDDAPVTTDGPAPWALAVAAGAAAVALALAIVVLSWPGSLGGTSPADRQEQAEEAEAAAAAAQDAAVAAVPEVLSYDYRTLDADFAEAEAFLTDDFAEKRTALFDGESESGVTLRQQVVNDKVVVTARVATSGVTRVADDGERATIVVFVDQDSQKGKDAPRSLRMWATLSMVSEGDDWLLDDICTESDCS